MPEFEIRVATPDDAGCLVPLIILLAESEKVLGETTPDAGKLRMHLSNLSIRGLIAYNGEQAIGYALWFPGYNPNRTEVCIELKDLFVCKEYRRQGVAGALIARLREIAATNHYAYIALEVLKTNLGARIFYEAMHAETNTRYYRIYLPR